MFSSLSIKTRLTGIVAFMSLQLIVGGVIYIVSLANTNESMKSMYDDRLVCMGLLDKVMRGIMRNESVIAKAAMSDPPAARKIAGEVRDRIADIDGMWNAYMATDLTPAEKKLADDFAEARQRYLAEGVAPALAALQAGDMQGAKSVIQGPLAILFQPIRTKGDALITLQLDVAREQYEQSQSLYRLIRDTGTAATLLGIILAAVVGRWQIRAITRPLDEAVQLATSVAKGDLACHIEVLSSDETGRLLRALKDMRDSLVQNAAIEQAMTNNLRVSEANLAEAQHMAHVGSWALDPGTGKMTWSAETFCVLGLEQGAETPELADFLLRIHEEDRQRVQEGLDHSVATGKEFSTEHRVKRPDGALRWVQTISRRSASNGRLLLRGTIMDITERKGTFDSLMRSQKLLLELTEHRAQVKEDERRRIAREIHDELGQTLLALRLDVSLLEARTRHSHPLLNQRVRDAQKQLDATMKAVRSIINNLRPSVLDLGLTAAIEWQVNEFRRRSGIACDLEMDAEDYALDDQLATTLFRILQESLTNVIQHAHATHVLVDLRRQGASLGMRIVDNGIGMPRAPHSKKNSFGLIGVEERVHALNGEFSIDSKPGEGTILSVSIPLGQARQVPGPMTPAFSTAA